MEEDYVSFEIAKLLKYKGANFDTDQVYTSMGRVLEINMKQFKKQFDYEVSNYIQRPTLQMAMKWLWEIHNLWCEISWGRKGLWCMEIFSLIDEEYIPDSFVHEIKSYEEACESAIKYCLENLI